MLTDKVCLYYISMEKAKALGITEEPFDDKKCSECSPERQSGILCYHYVSQAHLEVFKRIYGWRA